MNLKETMERIEDIKDSIWNRNKPLLLVEYKKYTNNQFISILNMITRDLDKLYTDLVKEKLLQEEILRRKEKARDILLK